MRPGNVAPAHAAPPLKKNANFINLTDQPLSQRELAVVRRRLDFLTLGDRREAHGTSYPERHDEKADVAMHRKLALGLGGAFGLSDAELGVVLGALDPVNFVSKLRLDELEISSIDFRQRINLIFEIAASARIVAGAQASSDRQTPRRVLDERGLLPEFLSGSYESLLSVRHALYVVTEGAWGRNRAKNSSDGQSDASR